MTETEKRGLSALAPLAGVPPPPSGLTPGAGKSSRPIAQAKMQLELPEFDPKNLPEWAEEFAEFLLLTGQSHVDVATKCSLLKRSCKKKFLQKQVKQIVKTCSTWAEVLQRLEKTFPVYQTDLNVRTQIEELPMLPEVSSAVPVSEYVCDLEYLFSLMNVGSYGATEPHLWLMSKIHSRTWDDCRTTSERKSRTHTYDDLVDLLIELALERENDSHMGKVLKKHLGQGGTPTAERGEGKGPKNSTNANQGGGKGRGKLRAMSEVKPEAGTPLCSTVSLSMTRETLSCPWLRPSQWLYAADEATAAHQRWENCDPSGRLQVYHHLWLLWQTLSLRGALSHIETTK